MENKCEYLKNIRTTSKIGENMNNLILASESPRRRNILSDIGASFDVIPSNVDENIDMISKKPEDIAKILAYRKAYYVAEKLKTGLVIGADTIVSFNGKVFGKPVDDNEAFSILSELSGNMHQVITGLALIDAYTKKELIDCEISNVEFSILSEDRIKAYIKTKEHIGKAGSYAIQGKGSLFVEKISGCYFNIVGLPLNKLDKMLKCFDFNLL